MKKKFFVILLIILMPFFGISNISQGANYSDEENINISVYEKIAPSIVSIEARVKEGISSGTGCVIDESGTILTSRHVVIKSNHIEVTTPSGRVYPARILAILQNNSDLALIKIEPKEKLGIISLGDSEAIKVGQRVLTIGNPFGFRGTLTTGIISRIDYEKNRIQTDAAINPGCSGGPLLNIKGEVIGINQSIYNPDNNRSNIGIGFAIPINNAKDFIDISLRKMASGLD